MSRLCKAFLTNQSGTTAIEYSLIASLIAIVMVGALTNLGARMSSEFAEIGVAMSKGVGASVYQIEAPIGVPAQTPQNEAVLFPPPRPSS